MRATCNMCVTRQQQLATRVLQQKRCLHQLFLFPNICRAIEGNFFQGIYAMIDIIEVHIKVCTGSKLCHYCQR